MHRMKLSIAGVAALVCCAALVMAQDPAQPPPEDGPRRELPAMRPQPPTLRVTGSAQTQAAPDHARVRLGAFSQAAEAAQAQDQVNQVMQRALAAVKGLGIDEKSIRTADLSLYPIQEQPRPMPGREQEVQEPRIVGYRASNTVIVDLEDLSKIGPVIDACVGVGANQLQGVDFSLKDDVEARAAALEKAVGDARRKAEALARAAGMRLGPIMELIEEGAYIQPPQPMMQMRGMAMEMAAPTPVQPGQLEVYGNVIIVFHLRPAGEAPADVPDRPRDPPPRRE